MKKTDITSEQITQARKCSAVALAELKRDKIRRFGDAYYGRAIEDLIFYGVYWRRIARMQTVADAKRELLYVAKRMHRLFIRQRDRLLQSQGARL